MPKICILGAGVVGLSTATILQDVRPDLEVTVIADKFDTETTSDGAAGIFRPSSSNFRGKDDGTTIRWIEDSYYHYRRVLESPDALLAGVKEIWVNVLSTEHEHIVKNGLLERILPYYHFLSSDELSQYDGGPYKYGSRFKTLIVENRRYLPYLINKFKSKGGTVINQKVDSLSELAGQFDAVFNCTGFGSRVLCGDTSLTPIRGQVIKVRAPWIKESYYCDFDTYIIPGMDLLTLGGCRQFDSWNTELDKHDTIAILERCHKLLPSLKDADVVRQWTGFRPYRPEVRVEREVLEVAGKPDLTVVHNYGHGGYGVTAAPGTSIHAVNLLLQVLPPPPATAKL